jgi:hypothetical protein
LSVVSAAGFPTTGDFIIRADNPAPATTYQYLLVTAVSGTTFTVTGGQGNTTDINLTAGATVSNDITAEMLLAAFPWGWLGEGDLSATVSSISAETNLTGCTTTVNVGTNRKLKISAVLPQVDGTVAGDYFILRIYEDASAIQTAFFEIPSNANEFDVSTAVTRTPTAGSHTYKLTIAKSTGTGTARVLQSASAPAYILVEDIGAV